MSDEMQSGGAPNALSEKPLKMAKTLTLGVYALQALSILFGITFLIGVVINYLKRSSVQGTWLASHFQWQIGTFWVGLVILIIGSVTTFIGIGYVVILLGYLWILYRVWKGWLSFKEGQEIN